MSFLPVVYAPSAVDQVPDAYEPDLTLPWAAKASYIWALHPQNPLACDKGANPLVLNTTAGAVAPVRQADNTMEFQGPVGGAIDTGSWYKTTSSFIFGGGSTPPVIGGIAAWVKLKTLPPANFARIAGQQSDSTSPAIMVGSSAFVFGSLNGSSVQNPPLALGQWYLIVFQNDASTRRLYLNGVQIDSDANSSVAGTDEIFEIGQMLRASGNNYAFNGSIRQVAVLNGDTWTKAEIEDMYARPYAYYKAVDPPEATYIPEQYVPNLALPWAAKATHIWALHPNKPFVPDKGTETLEYHTTQAAPVVRPYGTENNTLKFPGWDVKGQWLRTTTGITLSHTDVGVSMWVKHDFLGDATSVWYAAEWGQNVGGEPPIMMVIPPGDDYGDWGAGSTGNPYDVGVSPPGVWLHKVWQVSGGNLYHYVNGVLVSTTPTTLNPQASIPIYITACPDRGVDSQMNGEARLFAITNGNTWTDAEILDMYQNPYAYYLPVEEPDPLAVPDNYEPNTDLSWVNKATYIWALHPNAPMRCDKGGSAYDLVPGWGPVWDVVANTIDNQILFYPTEWRSGTAFRLGENPDAGKSIFGVAWWQIRRAYKLNNDPLGNDNWLNNFSFGDMGGGAGASYRIGWRGLAQQFGGMPISPIGDAIHLCLQVHLDGTSFVYVNGVKYAGPALSVGPLVVGQMMIGASHSNAVGPQGFIGEMRQVMVINGAHWTDAEIAEMAARPYAYYKKPSEDPPAVPADAADYAMNTQLSWVNKSSYIWALHPTDPLKADKGANDLVKLSGAETVNSDNWIEFFNTRYQSTTPFRLGANADGAKSIGGVAMWWNRRAANTTNALVGSGNYAGQWGLADLSGSGYPPYDTLWAGFLLQEHIAPSPAGVTPRYAPCHVVWQIKVDGTVEWWLNGAKVHSIALTQGALAVNPFDIGVNAYSTGVYYSEGAMRQVAVLNGANWTDQEINLMYLRPYAFYGEKVGYKLEAETGYYILTGQQAALKLARRLVAEAGIYNLTGQDAILRKAWVLAAEHGTYTFSGQPVGLILHRRLVADTGYFALTGEDAQLLKGHILDAETGYYALLGQDAMLIKPSAGAGRIYHVRGELRTVRIPADTDIWEK